MPVIQHLDLDGHSVILTTTQGITIHGLTMVDIIRVIITGLIITTGIITLIITTGHIQQYGTQPG